jgi:hypothetical protein
MVSERTTVGLDKETVERLRERMPYESTTYDEIVNELLDAAEGGDETDGRFG